MADEILEVNGSTLENASQSEVIQYIYEVLNVYLSPKFQFTPAHSRGSVRNSKTARNGSVLRIERFRPFRESLRCDYGSILFNFRTNEHSILTICNSYKNDKSTFLSISADCTVQAKLFIFKHNFLVDNSFTETIRLRSL